MKLFPKLKPNSGLLILLFFAFIINVYGTYMGIAIIPKITQLVTILILLTFFFSLQNRMANVFLTIFLLLFLGDAFSVFSIGDLTHKLSSSFNLGAYVLLVFVLIGKLKRVKFEGLVSVYLILILLLNTYFMYVLYGVVKNSFSDSVNLLLFICHGVLLITITFLAFAVYLSNETTLSINFLVMGFCFVFSDVLSYICDLYVYYWVFDFLKGMLHLTGIYLFYQYVINHQKIAASAKNYALGNKDISQGKEFAT